MVTRVLAWVVWMLRHLAAAAFFGLASLVAGMVLVVWLAVGADLGWWFHAVSAVSILLSITVGALFLPPYGPPPGRSSPAVPPPHREPDDPLERLYAAPAYRPPPRHRIRRAAPPAALPSRKDRTS